MSLPKIVSLQIVTATLVMLAANSLTNVAPAVLPCNEMDGMLPTNCRCNSVTFTSWNVMHGVRITCPQIELEIYPNNVTINCLGSLKKLPAPFELKLGSVSYLTLQNWTSTDWSFREITNHFGIGHVYSLRLQGVVPTLKKSLFCNLTNVVMIELNNIGLESIAGDLFDCLGNEENDERIVLYLEMNKNNIKELSIETFSRLKKLSILSLARNQLTNIAEHTFYHNSALKRLNLSYNKLKNLPVNVFANLTNLTQLELQGNLLMHIPKDLLAPLKNLEILNLGGNQIKQLSYAENLDLEKLIYLDLRDNRLTSLDGAVAGQFVLHASIDLTHLQLNGNQLSQMYEDWSWLTDLSTLNLSHNTFTHLQIDEFGFRSNIIVDLSHNLIREVNITTAIPANDNQNRRCTLLLHDNPFCCDCKLYPFVQHLQKSPKLQVPHAKISPLTSRTTTVYFEDARSLKCSSPKHLTTTPLLGSEDRFTSEISDENYSCPAGCSCLYRPKDGANIINCMNAGLKTNSTLFSKYNKANQIILNLQGNHLENFVFMDSVSDGFINNITVLNLSNTALSDFFASHRYRNLKVLDLSHNNLTTLSGETLSLMTTMDLVMLQDNPWRCSCDNKHFITTVTETIKVGLIEEVKCPNGTAFVNLRKGELCRPFSISYVYYICLFFGGLLLAAAAAIYYSCKTDTLVDCYNRKSRIVTHPDDEDNKKEYDAFISFAEKDMAFVSEVVVPRLEGRYKLCLRYRDWLDSEPIPKQIIRSIQKSKRTIVVLSPAYLCSSKTVSEFTVAHAEAMQEKVSRLIIIMYRDITGEPRTDKIRDYIQSNACVNWEDTPTFWDQIFKFMPHSVNANERIGPESLVMN